MQSSLSVMEWDFRRQMQPGFLKVKEMTVKIGRRSDITHGNLPLHWYIEGTA